MSVCSTIFFDSLATVHIPLSWSTTKAKLITANSTLKQLKELRTCQWAKLMNLRVLIRIILFAICSTPSPRANSRRGTASFKSWTLKMPRESNSIRLMSPRFGRKRNTRWFQLAAWHWTEIQTTISLKLNNSLLLQVTLCLESKPVQTRCCKVACSRMLTHTVIDWGQITFNCRSTVHTASV